MTQERWFEVGRRIARRLMERKLEAALAPFGYSLVYLPCLSPDGRSAHPQGVYLEKGFWAKEAEANLRKLRIPARVDLSGQALLLFPESAGAIASGIAGRISGRMTPGLFFGGHYPGPEGTTFGGGSDGLLVGADSPRGMAHLIAAIAHASGQKALLLYDCRFARCYLLVAK